MNRMIFFSALLATLSLAACDKQPTVVNVPAAPAVVVPGPAGPPGATGAMGDQGTKGDTGKTGDSTTVIVAPPAAEPASAPAN